MFAGKTTELIRLVRRQQIIRGEDSCIILKPRFDTRDPDVCTHDGQIIKCETFENYSGSHEVVAVDEGQFIPNLKEFCLNSKAKVIIIAALIGDFELRIFQPIADIMPIANKIKHFTAICICGKKAPTTMALYSFDRETIGGSDKYAARCRECR
jgi:thymidine kinase